MLRRKIVAVLSLLLTLSSSFIANAASEDEQWPIPNTYQPGHHSVLLVEAADSINDISYLEVDKSEGRFLCASLNDSNCGLGDWVHYQAILPRCESQAETDCLEGITAILPDGTSVNGAFNKYIYGGSHPNKYVGDGVQIPLKPSEPSIWNLPGAAHNFGNEYAIAVELAGGARAGGTSRNISDFSIRLAPVSEMPTSNAGKDANGYANYPYCQQLDINSSHPSVGCGSGAQEFGQYRCAFKMIENATCLLQHAFPENVRFKVSIRLKYEPNGMFHGRLNLPEINVTTTSAGSSISVEAGSVRVPALYYGDLWGNLSQELKDYWTSCVSNGSCRSGSRNIKNPVDSPTERNLYELPSSYGDHAISLISLYSKYVQDTSVSAPSLWSMHLLSANEMGSANRCFSSNKGFLGVVSTNSTTYSAGPPTFSDGFLNYKVASLHYLPNKSVFQGTYSLVLRSDVARCIYGFSSAPVSATVQIISADGSNQVATTVVSEKNNFLNLSANGFTFSSPTVRVQLSQEASPLPTPEMTTQASPQLPVKKATITCSKGKLTKKITASKPICPKGYKKPA